RLYAEMLEENPAHAPIRGEFPTWQAAQYAARAGTGPTGDDSPPDKAERTRLRWLALGWMRAELDAWTSQLAPNRPETRRRAADFFHRFQTEPAMAGVRDPQALAGLPNEERAAWQAFWDDLAARMPAGPN